MRSIKQSVRISNAEWEVMTIVWERSPLSSSAIVEALSSRNGWRSRTIRTLLDRLVKKRALRADWDGKRYLYTPRVSQDECVRRESRAFLDRVFGGEPAAMLIQFVKQTSLTPEQIRELKRILDEKEV